MKRLSKTLMVPLILLAFSYAVTLCLSENYIRTYSILDRPDGTKQYKLNVVVTPSLYEYYAERGHKKVSKEDFPKFVTPHALKPIAEKLWEIYQGDYENFANGVLMIVHQIPYEVTAPAKYPVETIVENKGDCDLLSYVAASLMKAIGLDVVLLYYKDKAHMNVGVNLPTPPQHARTRAYYANHNGVKYYVAECTGGNLRTGWRVGECPPELIGEHPIVITLENCEEWSPGQVSAGYTAMEPSALSLTVSAVFAMQRSTITISGQLVPKLPDEKITIYIKKGNSPWTLANTTTTDSTGQFTCILSLHEAGIYYVRASWYGNDFYGGADSPVRTVTVLPAYFVALPITVVVVVCLSFVILLISRQSRQEMEEQMLPEIPM